MIHFQRTTRNDRHAQIARRYWALQPNADFEETVGAIGSDYGITVGQVLGIVRSACRVVSTVHQCVECGAKRAFTSRREFMEAKNREAYVCPACTGDADEAESDRGGTSPAASRSASAARSSETRSSETRSSETRSEAGRPLPAGSLAEAAEKLASAAGTLLDVSEAIRAAAAATGDRPARPEPDPEPAPETDPALSGDPKEPGPGASGPATGAPPTGEGGSDGPPAGRDTEDGPSAGDAPGPSAIPTG